LTQSDRRDTIKQTETPVLAISAKGARPVMIRSIQEAAMQMASLSIYKGILDRTVPRAFYRLLKAGCKCAASHKEKHKRTFLEAWGDFFAVLCQRGFSESFARCLTQTALFDQNAFSMAAAGCEESIPDAMKQAVKRDITVISQLAKISPEFVLEQCGMSDCGLSLPFWKIGEPVELFQGEEDNCLHNLWEYYRCNGCGMYARYRAFIWRDKKILPVAHPDPQRLCELKGYEVPRSMAIENTVAFLRGLPANNCLLYGDRGTGKSSTVKALLNEYYTQGLRVIEMPKEYLMDFPYLVDQIAGIPMKFIIFIDDLSFSQQDGTYAALKSVLQGGLAAKPANALIYATSNRRHLLRENFSDRNGDDLHRNDTIQECLSLADRFGLAINFTLPDKAKFLEIVQQLAFQKGIEGYLPQLEKGAEQWAMVHGGRSPRVAQQYIAFAESALRQGKPLE